MKQKGQLSNQREKVSVMVLQKLHYEREDMSRILLLSCLENPVPYCPLQTMSGEDWYVMVGGLLGRQRQ